MSAAPAITFKSRDEALAAIAEVKRVSEQVSERPRLRLVDENFKEQADFVEDCSELVAVLCTRRAGKSFGAGLKLFSEAKKYPGCTVLYVALTKASAKRIMWKDVLKAINRKYDLKAHFKEGEMVITLPNGPRWERPYDGGSEIVLVGMDASKDEMEKVLGGKYRLVLIDEAGSYRIDLRKFVHEHLEPAVADWEGYIVLIGTPTAMTFGLFYDITKTPENAKGDENPIEPGWSVHRWSTENNPYMRAQWAKQEKRIIGNNPDVINLAWYRRMRKAEWVKDENDFCYKYKKDRNYVSELPKDAVWANVLGVDLGFEDSSSFVIQSWREYDKNLYTRHASKRPHMIISEVAERIKYLINKYHPIACVVDGASKQAVEELKQRFDLPLEKAEKVGKAEFIEIMNSEYILGTIKLTPESEPTLGPEYKNLIWDPEEKKKRKWVELEGLPNDAADAALYSWRKALQFRADDPPEKETIEERLDREEEEEAERIERGQYSILGITEDEEDDHEPERLLDVG